MRARICVVAVAALVACGGDKKHDSPVTTRFCTIQAPDWICQVATAPEATLDAAGINQGGCSSAGGTSYGVPCLTTGIVGRCDKQVAVSGSSIALTMYSYPPNSYANAATNCIQYDGGTFTPGDAIVTGYCSYTAQYYCLEATASAAALAVAGVSYSACTGVTGGHFQGYCDSAGRVGRCSYTIPSTTVAAIRHWYPPTTLAAAQADCTLRGGTFTAN